MIESLSALRARLLSAQSPSSFSENSAENSAENSPNNRSNNNASASVFDEFDGADPRKLKQLSLEQQKKRARELLLRWRDSSGHAQRRLLLADAQRVIAREHGFEKWTDLKAHIERMDASRQALEHNQPSALDGDHSALHIRCGSDIQHALAVAGFSGDFLVFADPYVHGPVPETETLAEFIQVRVTYVSGDNNPPYEQALKGMTASYAALNSANDYEAVYLWSEHDSYDQLICAKILDHFSEVSMRPPSVKMINITQFAGVEKFGGLGHLPPVAMRELWTEFAEVSEPQYLLGKQAWKAIRSPTPKLLQSLVESGMPELPAMAPALGRHLKQLPSEYNGLNLTENLTLEILNDKGALTAARLFGWYTNHYEPLPFMGDSGFWHQLEDLATAKYPAIQIVKKGEPPTQWQVCLTEVGRDLLAAKRDWLELNDIDRWVGGIHIDTESDTVYRV